MQESEPTSTQPSNASLAAQTAETIWQAFHHYHAEFKSITRRAKICFEQRDWHAAQKDAVERLDLYKKIIDQVTPEISTALGEHCKDAQIWAQMKTWYNRQIACCDDYELAETFFNSVTRRIFTTVGIDPRIEFLDSDFETRPPQLDDPVYQAYGQAFETERDTHDDYTQSTIFQILCSPPFNFPYQHLERDTRLAAAEISRYLQTRHAAAHIQRIEMIQSVFYRNKGAYLVGRIYTGAAARPIPLVICLLNNETGIFVDAVLLDDDEVSIVFSFTRSYFHVEAERPHELVDFLKTIMPWKRVAELYIAIGYNKHGKTELYRDLMHHIDNTSDQFVLARGEKGMVMLVFTLPSYDVVFKVIKDRIDPPKTTSRREVMEHYDLVFKHDRAGRLVDAQEFEHLSFERARFSEELLAELQALAHSMVAIEDTCVSIAHLYTERRLIPLNLYIKEASHDEAVQAVIDYGKTIKDLAATDIFPGDVLLKNFGVTRHGRVVFYDYDELCQITHCNFRRVPQATNMYDELESDPWFYVGPMDIFPEEFRTFLGLQEPLRSIFNTHHTDLFTVEFWKNMQKRHKAGEVMDIFPYPESRRLQFATL